MINGLYMKTITENSQIEILDQSYTFELKLNQFFAQFLAFNLLPITLHLMF